MSRDRLIDNLDDGLLAQLARLSPASQRWLKTAIQTVRTMPDLGLEAEPAEPPARSRRRPRPRERDAEPGVYIPPALARNPVPEEEPEDRPRGGGLEDVITGRAGLREQLDAYPELAGELEGLGDIIEMLRGLGRERRRRGDQILREDILGEPPEDSDGLYENDLEEPAPEPKRRRRPAPPEEEPPDDDELLF